MTGDGDLATLLVTFGVVFVGVLSVAYLFGTKPAKAPVKKAKRREKKLRANASPKEANSGTAGGSSGRVSSGLGLTREGLTPTVFEKRKKKHEFADAYRY